MATESLIIELDARTKKLDAKLAATDRKLDKLTGATKKADKSLKEMGESAQKLGKSLLTSVAGAAALTAGTIALINKTTEYGKQLSLATKLAGSNVKAMQEMASATATVGIDLEKLGDISKDTREKIGDFLNTGGGGFMDFVDAMKLTKAEARLVADEFSRMSGPDILQEMVTRMQAADVSAVQMSHALEGMASDTTNLIPLLIDGGREMKILGDAMAGVTVPLTDEDLKKLADLDKALSLTAKSAGNLANQTLVDLSDWFINAANAASFFFATLNEGTVAQKTNRLVEIADELKEVRSNYERVDNWVNKLFQSEESFLSQQEEGQAKVNALLAERLQLQKDLAESSFGIGEAPEKVSSIKGVGGDGSIISSGSGTGDEIQAIADRFKTEEELLDAKLERDLLKVGDNKELIRLLHDEHLIAIVEMEISAEDEITKVTKKAIDERAKLADKAGQAEIKLEQSVARNSIDLINGVLGESKAGALAGLVIQKAAALSANATATLSGSVLAFASQLIPGDPTSIVRAEAARDYTLGLGSINAGLIVATGLTQAASIAGGGGGGFNAGGGSGSATTDIVTQPDFIPETSSLEFTDATAGGSQSGTLNLATDTGDELIDVISKLLNEREIRGAN